MNDQGFMLRVSLTAAVQIRELLSCKPFHPSARSIGVSLAGIHMELALQFELHFCIGQRVLSNETEFMMHALRTAIQLSS